MDFADDYYDFHCGNDTRLVKVSVKNDSFHSITIEADVAKTIDFSGGTKKVEVIRLTKCFKATRIIWPERTGEIKRLYIDGADAMTRLDISSLESLEELSILNCHLLTEIIGVPASLKELNLHHVKIKSLDLMLAKELLRVNVITDSSDLDLNLSGHDQLHVVFAAINKKTHSEHHGLVLNVSDCVRLHTLYASTGVNPATIELSSCTGLTDATILCGRHSQVKNIHDCEKLEFSHISGTLDFDGPSRLFIDTIKKHRMKTEDAKNPSKKVEAIKKFCRDFYEITQNIKPSLHDRETVIQQSGSRREVDRARGVKITLLSTPLDFSHKNLQKNMMNENLSRNIEDAIDAAPMGSIIFPLVKLPFPLNPEKNLPYARVISLPNTAADILAFINFEDQQTNLFSNRRQSNLLLLDEKTIGDRNVLTLLQQLNENPELRKKGSIIFDGNAYYLKYFLQKHRLEELTKRTAFIEKAALLATVATNAQAIAVSSAEQRRYTNALIQTYRSITQRMEQLRQQTNINNSNMDMNLQSQMNANQLRESTDNFFAALRRVASPHSIMEEESSPHQGSLLSHLDIPPQDLIYGKHKTPPEQYPVDGDAESDPDPEKIDLPKNLLRTRQALAGAQSKPDAGKSTEEPSASPQTGKLTDLDIPPQDLIYGKHKTPPEQYPVDGDAELEPDPEPDIIDPKKALQDPFNGDKKAAGLENVPPMQTDGLQQLPIDRQGKISEPTKTKTGEQYFTVEEPRKPSHAALLKPAITPIDDQQLIQAGSANAESRQQELIETTNKLANAVRDMLDNVDGLPDQFLIDAKAANAEIPASRKDELLKVASRLGKAMSDMLANVDTPLQDQYFIGAEAEKPTMESEPDMMVPKNALQEPMNIDKKVSGLDVVPPMKTDALMQTPIDHQGKITGFDSQLEAANKLAKAVRDMLDNVDGLPDQVLVDAKAANAEMPASKKDELLKVASRLGKAMSDMLANVDAPLHDQTYIGAEAKEAGKKRMEDFPEQHLISAEARHTQTAAADQQALLEAAKALAYAVDKMARAAISSAPSEHSPALTTAAEHTNQIVLKLVKIKAHDRKPLLHAASDLINAMEDLRINLPLMKDKNEFTNAYATDDTTRLYLIERLNAVNAEYMKTMNAHPGIMVHTGSQALQAKILKRFLKVLTNTSKKQLTDEEIKNDLAKLMDDKLIAARLEDLQPLLTHFLAKPSSPSPTETLTKKNE